MGRKEGRQSRFTLRLDQSVRNSIMYQQFSPPVLSLPVLFFLHWILRERVQRCVQHTKTTPSQPSIALCHPTKPVQPYITLLLLKVKWNRNLVVCFRRLFHICFPLRRPKSEQCASINPPCWLFHKKAALSSLSHSLSVSISLSSHLVTT